MSLEKLLIFHCAPALAGIKPASLFAMQKGRAEARQEALALSRQCEKAGASIRPVDVSEKTTLFFVYNRTLLSKTLRSSAKSHFIEEMGYDAAAPLEACVNRLCERLKTGRAASSCGFPHEVGIFLGYPLEDVEGFIANGGQGCKMCGYWKVYGDEEKARALFNMYTECRRAALMKAAAGYSLAEACCGHKSQCRRRFNESSCYF